MEHRQSGSFEDFSDDEIALAIGYDGDAKKLVAGLIGAGFLDKETRAIHNWEKYFALAKANELHARKAASVRWGKDKTRQDKRASICSAHAEHMLSIAANESQPASKDVDAKDDDDVGWLEKLKADPSYQGIDVSREWGKMANWCKANGRKATRRRFINWLNRCDKPVNLPAGTSTAPPSTYTLKTQLEAVDTQIAEVKKRGFDDAFGLRLKTEDAAQLKELQAKRDEIISKMGKLT